MRFILHRDNANTEATVGEMRGPSQFTVYTLENPWRNNGPDSSIPAGTYTCKRVQSPTRGNTFEITGVPRRSHILFHAGNDERDTLGCVLLGMRTNGKNYIYDSRIAVKKFLDLTKDMDEFEIEVKDPGIEK
jgi:hypothetical protein